MGSTSDVSVSDAWVPLPNGPTVRASVCDWLVEAEFRGLRFRIEPDGRLHVGPRDRLHAEDLAFLRQARAVVVACVAYIDARVQHSHGERSTG